jgi:dihydropteroate synthase
MTPLQFEFGETTWDLGREALIMGILNLTPDSFSDGGQFVNVKGAVDRGKRMQAEGARIIDIGGESTRPGATPVGAAEEIRRTVPVIRALAPELSVPISIDTNKAEVAAAALEAGAAIVNDISGLHHDPAMLPLLKSSGAGCIIMHMRGTPQTMQQFTDYGDLIAEICEDFDKTLARAQKMGVPPERFILDPGIGFSKTADQNLELIARCGEFRATGRPVLIGPSRKSFIGKLLSGAAPQERIWGTAGAVACCAVLGADILRVHDVEEMRQVATVASAIRAMIKEEPLGVE